MWGIMTQSAQTTMTFDVAAEEINGFIDIPAALSAANRKQYHQVSASGNAKCYRVRVEAVKGTTTFYHASKGFITGNAVKMVSAGWKAQMRHAGINLRNLPPYGRRVRLALQSGAFERDNQAIGGESIYTISNTHLQPRVGAGGNTCFTTYTAADGMQIYYRTRNPIAAGHICANQITQVVVTDGAGTETSQPLVLTGADASEFNVMPQYLKARRQTPDVSLDTPGPTEDSDMLNLFSVAEELSDDIIDAVDDYMDYKPFTPDHKPSSFDDLYDGCTVAAARAAAADNYPPNVAYMDVPLGLLKISGTSLNTFNLTVEAVYEM